MATLGELVRQQRSLAGLSQRELADTSGVPVTTIKKIENDTVANPGWHTVRALATAMQISLDTLAGGLPPRDDHRGGDRS